MRLVAVVLACALWSAAAPSTGAAQTPGQAADGFSRKRVTVVRITQPPRIDGRLDDAMWAEATVIDDLQQYAPGDGDPPSERTEFRVAIDGDNLYIAARFGDSDPSAIKRSQLVQGQAVFNDDYAQVLLDTFGDRRTGYIFYVNPNGVQRDGLLLGGTSYNMDWDGIWQAAAAVDGEGWSAEFAIPFKTLSFDPDGDVWGINLIRSIRRKREDIAWSQRERRVTLDVAGELQGMRGLRQGRGLDLVPSVSLIERERSTPGGSSLVSKPSLDAFWRITPSLTGALTLNTDFSATEVDDRQVNLTRFSLFFPEKRDFFLEDAELFEFGGLTQNGRPFFSRTIGLSAAGQPIDLDAGARLTGKAGAWSLGALAVRQEESAALSAQDVFVARAYRRFGEQSTIGGIFTVGDPATGLDASLAGLDLALRRQLGDGRLVEGRAWAQRSDTPGRRGDQDAFGISLAHPNDRLDALFSFTRLGRDFRPALGFANRTGIDEWLLRAKRRQRFGQGGRWRSWLSAFEARQVDDDRGRLESRSVLVTPFVFDTQPGDQFGLDAAHYTEVLRWPFLLPRGLVVPVGRHDYARARLYGQTAGFRRLSFNWDLETGGFYDGDRDDLRVGAAWRPNSRFQFGAQYQASRIELPRGAFTTRVWSLSGNVAFDVRWAWLNVVQYDNVSRRMGLNSRLRWSPMPGQSAFLVVNHDWREDAAGSLRPFLAESAFKVGYTLRF